MNHLWATVKAVSDAGNGTFEAIASKATLDRDGEIVDTGAFSPLPEFVPIHVDHKMTSDALVGTGRPFYDGDVLKVVGEFAGTSRAQEVRQLVTEGHLSSMSVGFYAAKYKNVDGVPHVIGGELLEVSFVTVPANREARVLVSRAYRDPAKRDAIQRAELAGFNAIIALAELELATSKDSSRRESPDRVLADAQALLRRLDGRS